MASLLIFYALSLALTCPLSSSISDTLGAGSSLSVEKPDDDVLTSPNGVFTAGFHPIGKNAYYFAVWLSEPRTNNYSDRTIIWMANRDQPVNSKRSKLILHKTSNLILNDAGRIVVWSTATVSRSSSTLKLNNTGNLILRSSEGVVLWQSFDSPTDTLLPDQLLTRFGKLVSSRSQTNLSSGFYKLFFDNDNVLRLIYDSIQLTSVYWPSPWLITWDAGRSTYNNSKLAMLDSLGNFSSSDDFTFMSADYGKKIQRRLKLDPDGNIRLYSRQNPSSSSWTVSWQAFNNPCAIHGVCGPNSICNYEKKGRKCSCLPGHKIKNHTDWSYGCEPEFNVTFCRKKGEVQSRFLKIENTEFYGYDFGFYPNYTLERCENLCLKWCNCKGFQYRFSYNKGYKCYPKTTLVNGQQMANFSGDIYLRLPKTYPLTNESLGDFGLACSNYSTPLERKYTQFHKNELVNLMLWFSSGLGGLEIVCVLLVWWLLVKSKQDSGGDMRDYLLAATGFKRFSFSELKKASKNFAKEIGRGAGGIVYKATLTDNRVAAIKRLSEAYQGEAEFLAEVNTIGRLNHMNLIEMWGYCAEGKHRLLVYEYLEHGTLKENLSRNVLDWKMRLDIAVGTAKGLAYLHDECLEWILHCDVKPQNILLGADYQPKVGDFGLSKLLNRGELNDPSFSRIRGTRGYMAPEWVTNQSITSKVDVYSYGIVVLEILTGKSPANCVGHSDNNVDKEAERENRGLVKWVKEMVDGTNYEVEKIMDPSMKGEYYDKEKMGNLLRVALKCVEVEKDARPTMSQVLEMLQDH